MIQRKYRGDPEHFCRFFGYLQWIMIDNDEEAAILLRNMADGRWKDVSSAD
jgi:hypothetical protein